MSVPSVVLRSRKKEHVDSVSMSEEDDDVSAEGEEGIMPASSSIP